ncbi:S8 family serine peptidase [Solwaraspora sp. WMMA2080]|uniref:S8 family serine peptidase n=1 Tax=unclassified Solwaraspora TaxID=2627926 RepID=UPI00248C4F59|nr:MULTISPECIES: S8 family serine peptidase [unclassified Solwaraspora]WBB97134.1 S8 family serine peptidase [Solwaraspora sp. WMMA2059]WBC18964.1 S8 family serine peptidase [Solwaraspora sp. WMMA2080]
MRASRRSIGLVAAGLLGLLGTVPLPAGPAQADETRDQSWHVEAMRLPEAHRITQGEGVTVAVVDTGVDASHPDLRDNVLPGADLHDRDSKGHVDRRNHGTGMASLIAGHGHGPGGRDGVLGVAPKAKILPITLSSPKTEIILPESIALGINWAVNSGADIINVSLTGSSDPALEQAVESAYRRGVIVVAGIGNRRDILIGQPARSEWTIAVTSSGRDGGLSPESIRAEQTHIAAPGEDIVQAAVGGGYYTMDGASSATALVSGAFALLKARYPDEDQGRLFQRLVGTAYDAGPPGKDLDFGWGILDIHAALTTEPDDRASPRPSPTASDPVAYLPPEPGYEFGLDELIGMLIFFTILGTVVTGIVLLIRWLRRRAGRPAGSRDGPPPMADVGAPVPAPAAQAGPDQPTGGEPPTAEDDSVWRPPSR